MKHNKDKYHIIENKRLRTKVFVRKDVIESPVMPPKKEFQVELTVKSIQRGKP